MKRQLKQNQKRSLKKKIKNNKNFRKKKQKRMYPKQKYNRKIKNGFLGKSTIYLKKGMEPEYFMNPF